MIGTRKPKKSYFKKYFKKRWKTQYKAEYAWYTQAKRQTEEQRVIREKEEKEFFHRIRRTEIFATVSHLRSLILTHAARIKKYEK